MTSPIKAAAAAAVLSVTALACGGGSPSVQESPSAVPGMDGQLEPSFGPGVSEQPDV